MEKAEPDLALEEQKEDMLIRMLRREAELRVSPEVQDAMEKAEMSVDSEWMDVIDKLQKRIIVECQASGKDGRVSAICVNDLRQAAQRYPDIAFWVKYNRAREGTLRVGDAAPDVPLRLAESCQETTLLAAMKKGMDDSYPKPCVVVAGSLS